MSHLFALQLPAQKTEEFVRLAPLLQNVAASRRGLMLAPLIAALPASLVSDPAQAIDPNETQVTLTRPIPMEARAAQRATAVSRDGAGVRRD
jgi:hypothetical protein